MSAQRVLAVIVHYRNAPATARCLQSIAAQTVRPDLGLLEQSHANADQPAIQAALDAVADTLPVRHLLTSPTNLGFAGGSNAVIRAWLDADIYDFVWLLNPDATADPNALASLLARATAAPQSPTTPKLAAIASDLGSEEPAGLVALWRGWAGNRRVDSPDWISAASILLRIDALRETGLFDESLFLYWEDVELCLRFRKSGWAIAVERTSHISHEGGGAVGRLSYAQDYYASRNALLVVRKHARHWLPIAAIFVLARVTLAKLIRAELARLRPSWTGWWHGLRGRGGPY